MEEKEEGTLSPYRVLDLTDEKGLMCGKLLGDLGADVIKIEVPDGDPARSIGPFYHDESDPEKSLSWFAFNTNKRGITLNIETADGREIFRKLVKSAEVVVESFPVGYMDKLGLGYSDLEKINPGIILVSITPFGQTGPYKDYKTSDIVAWALGGYMYSVGELERPPVRISHHSHAYLHTGCHAATGAMIALYHREMTGEGQFIDVSIHDCVTRCTPERVAIHWEGEKGIVHRGRVTGAFRIKRMWQCKDGYVTALYWSGSNAKRWNLPLVRFMDSKGMADDFIKEFDWDTFDLRNADQETLDKITEITSKFLMAHTKAELLEGAREYNVQLYPMATTADIAQNPQLAAREFWVELEHPELGGTITYPGAFAKTSEVPPRVSRRAPLIGEHNQEIYEGELGISKEELVILKQAKVI